MRFYSLKITNAQGQVYVPNSVGGFDLKSTGTTFSSQVPALIGSGMVNNPAAPNIEIDIPVYAEDTPQGRSLIRIHGVGLNMIGQASNLNGNYFSLSAGMAKGLPLATGAAGYAGQIISGQIFQAFGNWLGTDQTLDLIVNPGVISDGEVQGLIPNNNSIAFTWNAGQSLSAQISASLQQAFPNYTTTVSISPNLQAPNNAPNPGFYPTLTAFAQFLKNLTQPIGAQLPGGSTYQGVIITVNGSKINVFDGTQAQTKPTTQLNFQDLIGQPTWINIVAVSFKTVMRADLSVGDLIMFPKGVIAPYALTSPDAASPGAPSRSKVSWANPFQIQDVHYFGNLRQPDAESWNTTYTASVTEPAGTGYLDVKDPYQSLELGT